MRTGLGRKIKSLLKIFLFIALIAFVSFVAVTVVYSLGDEKTGPAISSTVIYIQNLSGEHEISLGFLEKDQVLCCQVLVRHGHVNVWFENEVRERLPSRKNFWDYWVTIGEDGEYTLYLDGDDATVDFSITVYEPSQDR